MSIHTDGVRQRKTLEPVNLCKIRKFIERGQLDARYVCVCTNICMAVLFVFVYSTTYNTGFQLLRDIYMTADV